MATTQFALVEELAFLVGDNLYSKHLVLSTEEALINILQNDVSVDGTIELLPMSSYHRLLLHRLAEIYGFAHQSVGEGDDRHLVLVRCPEAALPPVLVCDILCQYDRRQLDDGFSLSMPIPILRKEETQDLSMKSLLSQLPLEVKRTGDKVGHADMFAADECVDADTSAVQKPRNVLTVARRMIAHALGQRERLVLSGKHTPTEAQSVLSNHLYAKTEGINSGSKSSMPRNDKSALLISTSSHVINRSSRTGESFQKEHLGAAMRILSSAMGIRSSAGKHDIATNSK